MTNGKKIKELYPRTPTGVRLDVDGTNGTMTFTTNKDWWNAEYEEPTTKNCESCRYYGLHHEVCNYCYKCSLWTEGEPTTKNDLGVDCISRADAIRAMQNKAKKLTNEDTINGLCGAVAILYEMPSVTPQLSVPEVTALAEWISKLTEECEVAYNKGYADGMKAQAEPKTGHWIVNRKIDTAYDISGYKSWAISYVCEHCGFIHQAIENHGVYNYCPNCGAKVVELQESEEV